MSNQEKATSGYSVGFLRKFVNPYLGMLLDRYTDETKLDKDELPLDVIREICLLPKADLEDLLINHWQQLFRVNQRVIEFQKKLEKL